MKNKESENLASDPIIAAATKQALALCSDETAMYMAIHAVKNTVINKLTDNSVEKLSLGYNRLFHDFGDDVDAAFAFTSTLHHNSKAMVVGAKLVIDALLDRIDEADFNYVNSISTEKLFSESGSAIIKAPETLQ